MPKISPIIPRVADLSHYDDVQDKFVGAVKFGLWGIINKASEGVGSKDNSFDWRRAPAKAAGLLYGSYHFLHPGRIEQQGDWYLHCIGDPKGELISGDHEDENGSHASAAEVMTWLKYMRVKVGRLPWLYSGNLIKEQLGSRADGFWKEIFWWMPEYSSTGNFTFHPALSVPQLIQYTGDGAGLPPHNIPGIVIGGKGIDINHFSGTREELAGIWAENPIDNDRADGGSLVSPTSAPAGDPAPPAASAPDGTVSTQFLPPAPPQAPAKPDDADAITAIADASPIARYQWRGRGAAPAGYTQGMALTFAQTYRRLKAGHPAAIEMAKANTHVDHLDALAWYNSNFAAVGMSNDTAGADTLRHLFVLMMGHGMRESSGKYCCGWDREPDRDLLTAMSAEAGLFQTSYNAHDCHKEFDHVLDEYLTGEVRGFHLFFAQGVACSPSDWENFGSGRGADFQRLCKTQPAFSVETAAIVLRNMRTHYGPINRKEAELRPEANEMLRSVQAYVDQAAVTA